MCRRRYLCCASPNRSLRHYTFNVPQEPPTVIEGSRPPANWPTVRNHARGCAWLELETVLQAGGIEVKDLVVEYKKDTPVLKKISFEVKPCEKASAAKPHRSHVLSPQSRLASLDALAAASRP